MINTRILIIILVLVGISQIFAQTNSKIVINDDIQLIHLQDSIYIHTTWHNVQNFGRVGSNGMIVIKSGEAIMFDTPMDIEKTKILANYIKDSLKANITTLVGGHSHDDCLGGLEYLHGIGVKSIANYMTVDICKEQGLPIPNVSFKDSLNFNFNGLEITCRYFGGGHTVDNITVWINEKNILFGGCLVKSANSKGMGYIKEAVLNEWDLTIEKTIEKYTDITIVVPGHGKPGGKELLTHTIELVKNKRASNN